MEKTRDREAEKVEALDFEKAGCLGKRKRSQTVAWSIVGIVVVCVYKKSFWF